MIHPASLRVHVLQHVPFEGPGSILAWAAARNAQVLISHLYLGDSLPHPDDFDFLVIMGGPMSVNDEDIFPWLPAEKELVRKTLEKGASILGICLGAQLIASALGCRVYPGQEKEIGWFPIHRVSTQGAGSYFPESFTPLHWHGETFDLPAQAVRLASTEPVPNQAFQIGRNILGLQFHIEVTPDTVVTLIEHSGHEIGAGDYQQPPEEILQAAAHCEHLQPIFFAILDYLNAGD